MSQKTVVARILASPEQTEQVKNALIKLAAKVQENEPDVLDYHLHQDNETPELFIMFESYKNSAAFEHHLNTDHLGVFQAEIEGKLQELSWRELTPV